MLAILFVRQILAYVEFEIGKIRTVVGTGEKGYAGAGGPAIECLIGEAYGCAFDINGNLYICDGRNHTVRRIDKVTQVITTEAGTGEAGYSGDGGPATQATVNDLYSLTVDTDDDIYIVGRYNAAIRKVDSATGIISTVAGTGEPGYSRDGGPGTLAQIREPNDCFLDDNGGLLIADIPDPRIRRLVLDTRIMTTFAGDGEKATASRLPKRLSWPPGGLCGQQRQHLHRRERGQRGPKGRCQRRDVHFCRHRRTWLWRRRRTGIGRRLRRSQSYALRQSRRPDRGGH